MLGGPEEPRTKRPSPSSILREQLGKCAFAIAKEVAGDAHRRRFVISDPPQAVLVELVDPGLRVGEEDWSVRRNQELAPLPDP
jgi:hypothetical protein